MTVEGLVAELLKGHPGAKVVIEDADTHWLLNIQSVDRQEGVVIISGNYYKEGDYKGKAVFAE